MNLPSGSFGGLDADESNNFLRRLWCYSDSHCDKALFWPVDESELLRMAQEGVTAKMTHLLLKIGYKVTGTVETNDDM